jgi:hypothetical protein
MLPDDDDEAMEFLKTDEGARYMAGIEEDKEWERTHLYGFGDDDDDDDSDDD